MTKEKSRIPNLGHRANRENKREIETTDRASRQGGRLDYQQRHHQQRKEVNRIV